MTADGSTTEGQQRGSPANVSRWRPQTLDCQSKPATGSKNRGMGEGRVQNHSKGPYCRELGRRCFWLKVVDLRKKEGFLPATVGGGKNRRPLRRQLERYALSSKLLLVCGHALEVDPEVDLEANPEVDSEADLEADRRLIWRLIRRLIRRLI